MRQRPNEAGFVMSGELLLIAVVLCLGLITGWVKLRDQSLAEIKDSMAAIDAYILGAGPLWQTGGTRWIENGSVVEPPLAGTVTERWDNGVDPPFQAPAAEPVSGSPGVFRSRDGFLIYGPVPPGGPGG